MDAPEFMLWREYYNEDPFGDQRQDERFAMLCQVVAAIVGKPPPLRSFLLYPDALDPGEPMTAEDIASVMQGVASWMNHGDNRRQAPNHTHG